MDLAAELRAVVGAPDLGEVSGGHQSRVFAAVIDGERVVVKVVDGGLVDGAEHRDRLDVVARLAAADPRVCAPRPLEGRLVTEVDGPDGLLLVTLYDWADGRPLAADDGDDAELMGRALAGLHATMRTVDAAALPLVAALRVAPAGPELDVQLLHGDFGHGNLRADADAVRVFDLDDCGRGPALFDLANALYMVRFAAAQGGPPASAFEPRVLAGYAAGSGHDVDRSLLEQLVDLRVEALRVWLDDLDRAPVGIRTADASWHAVLRRFADEHRGR